MSHNYNKIDEDFCKYFIFLCEIGMQYFAFSLKKFKNLTEFGKLKTGVLSQPEENDKHVFEFCFTISDNSRSLGIKILKVTIFDV